FLCILSRPLRSTLFPYTTLFRSRRAIFAGMSQRGGAVHVVTTRRRYKGRVYATHLLRRSYREGEQVKNETLGNLSHLPEPLIERSEEHTSELQSRGHLVCRLLLE